MEWRQIPGFSKYLVNEDGDVFRAYKGGTNIILKKCKTRQGYVTYTLIKDDGHRTAVSAHRLVALAFLPNPNGYGIVKHKDGDLCNNHISNLEWGGRTEIIRNIVKISRLKYLLNKE